MRAFPGSSSDEIGADRVGISEVCDAKDVPASGERADAPIAFFSDCRRGLRAPSVGLVADEAANHRRVGSSRPAKSDRFDKPLAENTLTRRELGEIALSIGKRRAIRHGVALYE